MIYNYDPKLIRKRGKDQMRFELGDTQTDGGADTCALSDEEYEAILEGLRPGKVPWLYAKLYALEAILFKLSYQVNTKVDVLWYNLGDRAKLWQDLYEKIRAEIIANTGVPTIAESAKRKPPYFHTNMADNPRADNIATRTFPFRRMTE